MATLRKRGSKWHVQVRRSGQRAQTRSFSHKVDAETWARKIERDIDKGVITTNSEQLKTITVGDLVNRYRDEIVVNKRSAPVETYIVKQFLRHAIASSSLDQISGKDICQYRDQRLKTVQGGTVHRELAVLHHCFEVARKDWGYAMLINPVADITLPPLGKARTRRVTANELLSLQQTCTHKTLWSVIEFAIETGMRRSEIVAMQWEDVCWDTGTLHIPVTKNGHSRTIPLTASAIALLRNHPRTNECVFTMSGNAIRLAWERLKKNNGIEDLRFHDLRHEAISRFFEMGLSVPEVALISGHRDPRMLFRYTHLKPEYVAKKLHMMVGSV